MVVGAMLLSGSSAGLGIPKSPSFHSGLELAAAKDFNFLTPTSPSSTPSDCGIDTVPAVNDDTSSLDSQLSTTKSPSAHSSTVSSPDTMPSSEQQQSSQTQQQQINLNVQSNNNTFSNSNNNNINNGNRIINGYQNSNINTSSSLQNNVNASNITISSSLLQNPGKISYDRNLYNVQNAAVSTAVVSLPLLRGSYNIDFLLQSSYIFYMYCYREYNFLFEYSGNLFIIHPYGCLNVLS